jgi:hypothetical protein
VPLRPLEAIRIDVLTTARQGTTSFGQRHLLSRKTRLQTANRRHRPVRLVTRCTILITKIDIGTKKQSLCASSSTRVRYSHLPLRERRSLGKRGFLRPLARFTQQRLLAGRPIRALGPFLAPEACACAYLTFTPPGCGVQRSRTGPHRMATTG